MSKKNLGLVLILILAAISLSVVGVRHYRTSLCSKPAYTCIQVKKGDTWESLFPNASKRRLVMRVNRMNIRLYPGATIAVPKNLNSINHMDVSPMPRRIEPTGRKTILIMMSMQAFGAYDQYGYLVHWGPVSGGQGYCPDVRRRCNTPRGRFSIQSRGGAGCISTKYPVGKGGAPMPFCMFFYGGYAMHASTLPGYHASHGCVRMFYEDAKWLNREFTSIGTRVIIQ